VKAGRSKNMVENLEEHAVQAARDHSRWRDARKRLSSPKTGPGDHARPGVRFDSRW
jgi:hypothetical protein